MRSRLAQVADSPRTLAPTGDARCETKYQRASRDVRVGLGRRVGGTISRSHGILEAGHREGFSCWAGRCKSPLRADFCCWRGPWALTPVNHLDNARGPPPRSCEKKRRAAPVGDTRITRPLLAQGLTTVSGARPTRRWAACTEGRLPSQRWRSGGQVSEEQGQRQ
jgi:hypothetical protein